MPSADQDDTVHPLSRTEQMLPNHSYEYDPLPSNSNSFRFASLLPGAVDEPIHVDLETHVIEKEQESHDLRWEALSWLWGPYGDFRFIQVNGHQFRVTRNLYVALSHMRNATNSRLIWVDAICINQNDLAERSSQISQMAFLFHRASRVVAWLGEGDAASHIVVGLVRNLCDFESGNLSSCDENTVCILALTFGVPDVKKNLSDSTFHYWNVHKFDNWNYIDRIVDKELFRRSWVLQECALARKLVIQCGADTLSWPAFFRAVSLRYSHDERAKSSPTIYHGWIAIQAIENLRLLVATRQRPPDLLELLWACRNYKSTDPRDRIFALLGVSNLLYGYGPKQQLGFEIDYTNSYVEICRDFTMSMIMKYNDLRVLGTRRSNRVFDDKGLSSWCPDWDSLDEGVSLLYLQQQWSGSMIRYNAGAQTPLLGQNIASKNPPSLADGYVYGGWISLHGFILDTIQDVSHTSHFTSDSARLYDWHHWAVWPDEREWKESPPPRVDADPRRQDAFWRTVIADADANGNRHPVYLRAQFQAWYRGIVEGFKHSSNFTRQVSADEEYTDFLNRMRQVMKGRCLFETTKHGFLGIGDEDHSAELGGPQLKPGDVIAILDGGPLPVMLRKVPEQTYEHGMPFYKLIGDAFCYVHGVADGEALSEPDQKMEQFLII